MNHPSPFSKELYEILALSITHTPRVLDPFAGTGRCHDIAALAGVECVGVEIEPEWAEMHPRTVVGDALSLPFPSESFDAIMTSPVYGNRMSDHHDAKDGSYRRTYRHLLGRALHDNNAGKLQWGDRYRKFTRDSYAEISRCTRGKFVLNVSDHIRKDEVIPVTDFHVTTLEDLGFKVICMLPVVTRRFRRGENDKVRVENEWVVLLDRT